MELDKKFSVGDTALVVLPPAAKDDDILVARDHWRMGWGFAFFAAFCVLTYILKKKLIPEYAKDKAFKKSESEE